MELHMQKKIAVHSGQRVGNNMVPPMIPIPHDPMLGPPMIPMPQLSGEMMPPSMPPHPVMPPPTVMPPPAVQEMTQKQGKSKAGPPPDRKMEGSIDVIGGERAERSGRSRRDEDKGRQTPEESLPPSHNSPMNLNIIYLFFPGQQHLNLPLYQPHNLVFEQPHTLDSWIILISIFC
jgi:hypothetical protein